VRELLTGALKDIDTESISGRTRLSGRRKVLGETRGRLHLGINRQKTDCQGMQSLRTRDGLKDGANSSDEVKWGYRLP